MIAYTGFTIDALGHARHPETYQCEHPAEGSVPPPVEVEWSRKLLSHLFACSRC
jgi:hypothetical protein